MKETLEEAAEKANGYNLYAKGTKGQAFNEGFTVGAKYQAERMYSEEEVLDILYQWSMYKIDIELDRLADELPNILPYNEWFEQFKKTNNGK
jgi:hypothetical protein